MTSSVFFTANCLIVGALTASLLSGCSVQPHSPAEYHNEPQPQIHKPEVASVDDISGHYSRTLLDPHDGNIVVHIDKLSILKPSNEITLSVSTQPDPSNHQPACDYRGNATLMGQDALHGLIYTIPVQVLNKDQKLMSGLNSTNALSSNSFRHSNTNVADKGLVFFRFKDDILTIDSNNPVALESLCRGSISLKGDYSKL